MPNWAFTKHKYGHGHFMLIKKQVHIIAIDVMLVAIYSYLLACNLDMYEKRNFAIYTNNTSIISTIINKLNNIIIKINY